MATMKSKSLLILWFLCSTVVLGSDMERNKSIVGRLGMRETRSTNTDEGHEASGQYEMEVMGGGIDEGDDVEGAAGGDPAIVDSMNISTNNNGEFGSIDFFDYTKLDEHYAAQENFLTLKRPTNIASGDPIVDDIYSALESLEEFVLNPYGNVLENMSTLNLRETRGIDGGQTESPRKQQTLVRRTSDATSQTMGDIFIIDFSNLNPTLVAPRVPNNTPIESPATPATPGSLRLMSQQQELQSPTHQAVMSASGYPALSGAGERHDCKWCCEVKGRDSPYPWRPPPSSWRYNTNGTVDETRRSQLVKCDEGHFYNYRVHKKCLICEEEWLVRLLRDDKDNKDRH